MPRSNPYYIFVVGGVLSGLGKGIAVSSIGLLLKSRGYRVAAMKIDPYINVDAGTMNPTEHGEVFVTADGLETDQDIGNYERFLQIELTRYDYLTTGQVYQTVINRERSLGYGGKCVEVVPHVPEEIIRHITTAAKINRAQIQLVEIGGTVGEYQNMLFLEAARMMNLRWPGRVKFILLSYLPVPAQLGEMKTKPTQYAVRTLNAAGIQPDFILGRSTMPLDQPRKAKLSINCNMHPADVISAPDVKNVYTIPQIYDRENLTEKILIKFALPTGQRNIRQWQNFVRRSERKTKPMRVAVIGKYFATGSFTLSDSYLSVIEAVKHATWSLHRQPLIDWLDAERLERRADQIQALSDYDAIIVPGGFGQRGVEGIIAAIEFARRQNIPFLGICYGMQLAVVEYARHVLKWRDAHTTEVKPATKRPVIDLLSEQEYLVREHHLGGSMRLGAYDCRLIPGTSAARAYGRRVVKERHRHRYEFQNKYRQNFTRAGLKISGLEPKRDLVEIIELPGHPWFIGTQFHPEFTSRPIIPHPLFVGLMTAARRRQRGRVNRKTSRG